MEQALVDMMQQKTNLDDCMILTQIDQPVLRVGRIDVSKDR